MEESSVTGPCEWCLTFSGRLIKGRTCCELRMLAAMPKARRQDVYARVRTTEGSEALEKLKRDVSAEYQRLVAYREVKREAITGPAKRAAKAVPAKQAAFF